MEQNRYRYADQPLTPSIAEELALELFAGRIAERQKIIDAVVQAHRNRGGLAARAKDTSRLVKKALSNMQRSGLAENPSFGQWRISNPNPDIGEVPPTEVSSLDEPSSLPAPELTTGEGSESVYLYCYEAYRRLAQKEGRRLFPCKIGRSERDPLLRVLSQSSTALPEVPTVVRLFKTNDSSALEAAIHCILSLRGREVENSPGTEWFLTSPEEVDDIVRFISEDHAEKAEPGAEPNGGPAGRPSNSGVPGGPPSVS
jgi:hypothetical protein